MARIMSDFRSIDPNTMAYGLGLWGLGWLLASLMYGVWVTFKSYPQALLELAPEQGQGEAVSKSPRPSLPNASQDGFSQRLFRMLGLGIALGWGIALEGSHRVFVDAPRLWLGSFLLSFGLAWVLVHGPIRRFASLWLRWHRLPLRWLERCFSPVDRGLCWLIRFWQRGWGILPTQSPLGRASFWDEGLGLGAGPLLAEPTQKLLHTMSEFSHTVIREIMVPRTEMVGIAEDASLDELHQVILSAGHSRLPVYGETVDHIVGVLHVKDLFAREFGGELVPQGIVNFALAEIVRPTFYVPEVMHISELLREFQRRKTHMAIVVDEYGGTAGVVTLEDIIEEIVGEIQDEYDIEEKQFRLLGSNKILADGRVSVWDLEETLQAAFPKDAGFETLAGFLMAELGYLPDAGVVLIWSGLRFTVKEANERRVHMVEIERLDRSDFPRMRVP